MFFTSSTDKKVFSSPNVKDVLIDTIQITLILAFAGN